MSVVEVLRQRGGVATRAELIAATSRAAVDRALRNGAIHAGARGRYTAIDLDEVSRVAHETSGVLCLASAALMRGWPVLVDPDKPHVAYRRGRRLRPSAQRVHAHYVDLHPDDVTGILTSVEKTLEMCLRSLPWAEALAVADSFLRLEGDPATLRRVARSASGPGAAKMRRVTACASPDAANPFESALRAIALDVPGLHVRPQAVIRGRRVRARPDLVDADLGIVLEADSFAWHGQRDALHRDTVRYNRLVVEGWLVLRFSWEQVMFHADEVREILLAAVALREAGPAQPRRRRRPAA